MANKTDLAVKTDGIREVAKYVRNINKQINSASKNMKNSIQKLDASWDGDTSYKAINRFNSLYASYCTVEGKNGASRYKDVDMFVKFLEDIVGINYDQVEMTNISLGDSFK